ncbi:carboxylesterase family protein [Anditalea andensis]|uniref:Phospholipase n=1 Tax=Anditalea andensis TaxID=1048983 RepID=A0A074LLG9_9BACT|nr:alpha/beta hydrolase-fold protein [Anditalea andensis]KEO74687.1 phospholipase [Anditalea andensis]
MNIKIANLAITMLISLAVNAQDRSMFDKNVFVNEVGDSLLYRILYPESYDESKQYPLILFLHGAGERGNDNEKQLNNGADFFLDHMDTYPAIVVFPQCPEEKYWIDLSIRKELRGEGDPDFSQSIHSPSEVLSVVNELVEDIIKSKAVNLDQVYIMGLSMGSFGTFETLARWPEKYAAAVAICGGGNLQLAKNYADNTSLWITHGAKDDVVPPILSKRIYEKLHELGADVTYTEFENANHNAWDPTFAMPELLPWLFSKIKN